MFVSTGSTTALPPLPTLVATALPNSSALRAPYDNVAPAISNSQLDNNARSNSTTLPKTDIQQLSVFENITVEKFSLPISTSSISFTANAQTAFIVQLAGGDISPETHGLFVQYEKLLSYATVKYKPSNAGKPIEPINLFASILQEKK